MHKEIILDDNLNKKDVEKLYEKGYVLTRKKTLIKVKSVRIDLDQFDLTSENRRILRKTEDLILNVINLPLFKNNTNWHIYKLAKDFYKNKFENVKFSANKIREILTQSQDFPYFNRLAVYTLNPLKIEIKNMAKFDFSEAIGFAVLFETDELVHYAYPFYKINFEKLQQGIGLNQATPIPNLGIGMMLKSIIYAKRSNKKYIYLGSLSRNADRYKLQFKGIEIL